MAALSLSGGLPAILANLTAEMNNPFDIRWVHDTPKCILLFVAAYGLGVGIYFSTGLPARGGTRQRPLERRSGRQ